MSPYRPSPEIPPPPPRPAWWRRWLAIALGWLDARRCAPCCPGDAHCPEHCVLAPREVLAEIAASPRDLALRRCPALIKLEAELAVSARGVAPMPIPSSGSDVRK